MPTATQTTSKAPDATDRPEGGYVKALRGRESGIEYPIEPRTICDTDFGRCRSAASPAPGCARALRRW